MNTFISLLGLLSLTHLVAPQAPLVTSFRASVEIVSKASRIFSGENLELKCSISGDYKSSYKSYLWFRGSQKLAQTGETIRLWNLKVKDAGKFSCQGTRDTAVGIIKTQPSLPVEVNVDGGWAILQTPPHPFLIGETMNMSCRLRVNRPVHETILYKNDIEVMRQNGSSLHFFLTDATIEDNGMYSCRASWDAMGQTVSVSSVNTPVHVLEVLSKPVLEIDAENAEIGRDKIKLICHAQYNAPPPTPPINYYFYRNNNRLGTATSANHDVVRRTPGWYSCRAKVPQLGLSEWSEAQSFGDVTGIQMPSHPPVRKHMVLAPVDSPPEQFLTSSVHKHTEDFSPSFIKEISPLSKDKFPNQTQPPRY